MYFTWKNGYTKEVTFGEVIRGLTHNNQRPILVSLHPREIMNKGFSREELYSYLNQLEITLKP